MNKFSTRQIVVTNDGSSSIYLPDLDEHYHSIHGAIQESNHVFIDMGWREIQNSRLKIQNSEETISILEIGLGTGLNAFLVQNIAKISSTNVLYDSLEAYPLSLEDAEQLNFFSDELQKQNFLNLHKANWNEEIKLNEQPDFTLDKIQIHLEDFIPTPEKYDLVFFDAFSPNKQPELWTQEIFRTIFDGMKAGGILVTYCAKGQVRRDLIAAGFQVEKLAGPPGKKQMLRGRKN